jgi:hypothetical protein
MLIAAGVLALATLPMGWARVAYPTAGPGYVIESVGHVRAGVLVGAFMLVAGAVSLVARSTEVQRAWLVAGIACGIALGVVAVFDLLVERTRVIDDLLRASTRAGHAPPPGLIQYSVRAGIFVALAAAALALAAGVVLLTRGFRGRAARETDGPETT